jgi:FtsZ-binding cell division protein ZapB
MIPDFYQLSDKISQLAELTQSLRRENAELRMTVDTLTQQNEDLSVRMEEACRRVSALLDKIPAADEPDEEAA